MPFSSEDYRMSTGVGFNGRTTKIIVAVLTATVAAVLLFWNLGHYSLWDDESSAALGGKSLLRSGDISAWVDDLNLVAFGNGGELIGMRIRSPPPLPFYLTAGSMALFGVNTWAARLPFALCGLATVALMLWWARRASRWYFITLALAVIGNASFFLYARNGRYYALAMLLAVAVVWIYRNWRGRKLHLLWFALLSSLLFATHYSAFVTVYAGIAVDWLLWRRKEVRLTVTDLLVVGVPQVIINGAVFSVWNPLRTGFSGLMAKNDWTDRLQLFWWHLRDLNTLEFLSWPALLAALIVSVALWSRKKQPLPVTALRGTVAVVVAALAVAAVTSQVRAVTSVADMRYLICALPLGIALTAWAVCRLSFGRWWLWLPLTVTILFTNFAHGGMFFRWGGLRSTTWCFVNELARPTNADPFKPVARWIREHVAAGESVYVAPHYNTYSLMFHAPHALYAWQFEPEQRRKPEYRDLPAIHFKGMAAPDYLIGFGPYVGQLKHDLEKYGPAGVRYRPAAKVDVYWQQLYRPELFWRVFKPITGYDKNRDTVIIFRRVEE